MKEITTQNGQIFEIFESRKEAIGWIKFYDFNDMPEDDSVFIQYKDGSHFYAGNGWEVEGTFKKNNIDTIIVQNACTTQLFGNYRIYNMDDIDEEYSEAIDDEYKDWNADIR